VCNWFVEELALFDSVDWQELASKFWGKHALFDFSISVLRFSKSRLSLNIEKLISSIFKKTRTCNSILWNSIMLLRFFTRRAVGRRPKCEYVVITIVSL